MNLLKILFKLEYYLKGITNRIKRVYMYSKFKSVGKDVRINTNCKLYWPENMDFKNHIFIEEGAHLSCREGLSIGNHVMIGPNVTIIGGDHSYEDTETEMWNHSKGIDKKIIIEDDVWIGANVTLLKNAHIAKGCVIGACSVVTKKTEPYGVYIGNPAKFIKSRKANL